MRSGPVKPGLHWYAPEVTLSVEFFEMHGPPAGPEHHASQTQSVAYALAADEFELSGQRVQVALPFVGLYVPGAQFTHSPPSGPVNPLLQRQFVISPLHAGAAAFSGHIVQLALASAAYCPASHISHVALLSSAAVGEYMPTEQFVQSTLPFESLYVPEEQATHSPPSGPVYPMLHRQFVMSPLHAGAAEFSGHIVQFALASAAYCPASHISHVALLSAAKAVEYVPTEHLVQFAVPFDALYVPGRHALHWPFEAPVSGPVYPTLHAHPVVEFALKGALFKAQQSCIVVVPDRVLNPAGHVVHMLDPLSFEKVSGAHDKHDVAASASWY